VDKPKKVAVEPLTYVSPDTLTSLFDLRRDQCRFPVGEDEDYMFCGAQTDGKRSFCDGHAKRVYTPSKPYNPNLARKPKVRTL